MSEHARLCTCGSGLEAGLIAAGPGAATLIRDWEQTHTGPGHQPRVLSLEEAEKRLGRTPRQRQSRKTGARA